MFFDPFSGLCGDGYDALGGGMVLKGLEDAVTAFLSALERSCGVQFRFWCRFRD